MVKKTVKKAEKKRTTGKPLTRTPNKAVKKPAPKPTKGPAKKVVAKVAKKAASKVPGSKSPPEAVVKVERTWVVWQDGTGVHLGTPEDFRQSKRPETIVCDVLDSGSHRDVSALQRAVQVAQVLRQTYANCMRPWWQYDDGVQEQRVKDWEEQLRMLNVEK